MINDYDAGYIAQDEGQPRDSCPHKDPRCDRRRLWLEGWDQAEKHDGMPPDTAAKPA